MSLLYERVWTLGRLAAELLPAPYEEGDEDDVTASRFGGIPYAEEGMEWPCCLQCERGLSFIVQVDHRPMELEGEHRALFLSSLIPERADLFQFFYCQVCAPWSHLERGLWEFRSYAEASNERAVPIGPPEADPRALRPMRIEMETIVSFPSPLDECGLIPRRVWDDASSENEDDPAEAYRQAVAEADESDPLATRLYGYPQWLHYDVHQRCERCGLVLRSLLQIGESEATGLEWGRSGMAYLLWCPSCVERRDDVWFTVQSP